MTPSTSTNNISRPSTPTPQRGRPSPALHMRASCPEFGACSHSGSSSDTADDEDLVVQSSSYDRYSSLCDVVEVHGMTVVEVEARDDESEYGTALVPQVEFTSPGNVVIRSTVTTGTPSSSRSPSKARALAKIAGKAKGIAKMLSLRRLSRKPSMDTSIPMASSTSAVAVSGTWRDGASDSHTSPRRPPISILITSESMTDAITYHMSPNARITSSSSTTGIYTPDDNCSHDLDCPRSPMPSPVSFAGSFGADAARRFERALIHGDGDLFADMPKARPAPLGAPSNRNVNNRAASPLSAPPVVAAQSSALPAGPKQVPVPAKRYPFPNLLRLLLFMPWCIAVGATLTLFPTHIDQVVFSTGYISAPAPRGVERFCFWADTARDYACIFGFTLLSLFFVSVPAGWVVCALALARFVWVWGAYACASGEKCCCSHTPERLGEDDMESLAIIARGGDVANLVLRQCAEHAGPRPSRQ